MTAKVELEATLSALRKRLTEYGYKNIDRNASIHINSAEIAASLIDFYLKVNRPRAKSEHQWFEAGFHLDQVVGNSEWSDISDLYYQLITNSKTLRLI